MTDFQIAIIGGGLAGSLVAKALLKRWPLLDLMVFHDDEDKTSASQNTAALSHALPGRRLLPKPFQVEAYRASAAFLNASSHAQIGTLVKKLPQGKARQRYLKDLIEAQEVWQPEGVSMSLSDDESALHVHPARVVDLNALGLEIRAELQVESRLTLSRVSVLARDEDFIIHGGGNSFTAQKVIFAGGAGLFDGVSLKGGVECEGGETVKLDFDSPPELSFTKHGAYLVPTDGAYCLGATHRECGSCRPASEIAEELWERFGEEGHPCPEARDAFYGERAFVRRDRLPVCGEIAPGAYALTALASTGLLWAPYLAEILAKSILDNDEISPLFSPKRAGVSLRIRPASKA